MTRVRQLAAAVALSLVVTACGVRSQSSPSTIRAEDVPFGLLEPQAGTADPEQGGLGAEDITIYLVGEDGLVPVEREVAQPAGPRRVLEALVAGPTSAESDRGLRGAFDPEAVVPTVERDGRRILVELHESFFTEGGPPREALAQVVYTLTEVDPGTRVQFLVAGEPREVPRGDGVLTSQAVDRDDYVEFAPLASESAR
jgi:hypothetical protein